jgi:CheY-like chemotaxis protein
MNFDEFLSTGEAAQLLNISRSTVSRSFDQGILQGKKNPITGERLISRESMISFMKQYDLPLSAAIIGKKKILVGSSDEKFQSFIQKALASDQRIHIERVSFGGDVLLQHAKEKPDLLIIDEELPDISGAEVIRSLRRTEDPTRSKILCGMKTPKGKPGADLDGDDALAKEGLDRTTLVKKVYQLLDIPEELPQENLSYQHQRRWPRFALNIPAEVGVYSMKAPQKRDVGKAVMENISMGGAYLSQLQMDQTKLQGEPFRVLLQVTKGPMENFRVHCRVVRLQSNGSLTLGLQFVKLSKGNRSMIESVYRGSATVAAEK